MNRFILLAMLISPASATAAIFNVTLIDFDGPHIEGRVDTIANKFTVTSWTENLGGPTMWSPLATSLPLFYTARTGSGAIYDVPDNWDGTIDRTWGFISDLRNSDILWNEGTCTDPTRHHGWGAAIGQNGSVTVTAFDQMWWQWAPIGPTFVDAVPLDFVSVTPLPEPSTLALAGIALAALPLRRRMSK